MSEETKTQEQEQELKQEKFKKPTKANITRQCIQDGKSDVETFEAINEVYPGEAKLTCIRWYRYQDPIVTGRPRTTSLKKAEIHAAFKETLNAKTADEKANIILSLIENHFDSFILKIPVEELKQYIPKELLPKAVEKKEAEPKEEKTKKGKKGKNIGSKPEIQMPEENLKEEHIELPIV